jgi:predicted nucleic acid-binding protein
LILVDSSVWIDYFRGVGSPVTDRLDQWLGVEQLIVGDIVLTEVLQGFVDEGSFRRAQALMASLPMIEIGGRDVAVEAALNYRRLRALGVTVRKTIDTLIATRCLVSNYSLLHSDRDFEAFVLHLGLRSANPVAH